MTPTREEIVKLLRIGGEAAGRLRATSANASGRQTWAAAERNLATAADALDAAPVLTFEERVERAAAALWKIRAADLCEDLLLEEKPPWTDAPPMMAKLIRYQTIVVLRAAGVEE